MNHFVIPDIKLPFKTISYALVRTIDTCQSGIPRFIDELFALHDEIPRASPPHPLPSFVHGLLCPDCLHPSGF